MGTRYLFLALAGASYGESTLARRIAIELHARGDEIVVLSSRTLAPLWKQAPVRFGAIDKLREEIEPAVAGVIAKQRIDVLVLVDLTATIVAARLSGVDPAFVHRVGARVIALDIWDLPATNRKWDVGGDVLDIGGVDVPARFVPCPFASATTAGAYNALPAITVAPASHARRYILITTAVWQMLAPHGAAHAGIMDTVPRLAVAELAALDVDVVHVGPKPLPGRELLGERYRWHEQVPPDDMLALVAGAQIVVTLNLAATTIVTALACGVPVVVGVSSLNAASADALPAELPADVRAKLAPVYPFVVWPLGLHEFMQPVLAGNPYCDVVRTAEVLVPGALAAACRELLADPAPARARIAAYLETVRALPDAATVIASLC